MSPAKSALFHVITIGTLAVACKPVVNSVVIEPFKASVLAHSRPQMIRRLTQPFSRACQSVSWAVL